MMAAKIFSQDCSLPKNVLTLLSGDIAYL